MYQDDEVGYGIDDHFEDDFSNNSNENNSNDDNYDYEQNNNSNKNIKFLYVIVAIIIIVIAVLCVFSCKRKNNSIPELNIIEDRIEVKKGDFGSLTIELNYADNNIIEWMSENDSIATIDSYGNVSGVSIGKTNINAIYTHSDNQNYTDYCEVIVYQGEKEVELQELIVEEKMKIKVGSTVNVNFSYSPENSYVYSLSFQSNNEDVASISNDGSIVANKVGKATITIVVNENFSKQIEVEVYDKEVESNSSEPTAVKFNENKMDIMIGEKKKLAYSVTPSSAKNYNVEFQNSNNNVVSVDKDGNVKAFNIGTSTITIKVNNKLTDTITINVKPFSVGVGQVVVSSSTNVSLSVGGTSQIKYNVVPSNASNKLVSFESSNPKVAEVDVNGLIQAIGSGSCVITIKSDDGNKTAEINVTVN